MKSSLATILILVIALIASTVAAVTPASYNPATAMSAWLYSKAAYCDPGTLQNWNCGVSCQAHPNFQVATVATNSTYDIQAFVGYDPQEKQIVVSFRGTHNIKNWIADLSYTAHNYAPCGPNCQVHHGFHNAWLEVKPDVFAAVARMQQKVGPATPVFVTGHSLGAALSLWAAVELSTAGVVSMGGLTVYNFGEPRTGNPAWAAYVSRVLPEGKQFRLTHHRDPVPHVPPASFKPTWLHAPHEIFYKGTGSTTGWVSCNDSPSKEDKKCSDQYWFDIDISDHLNYLDCSNSCNVACSAGAVEKSTPEENRALGMILAAKARGASP